MTKAKLAATLVGLVLAGSHAAWAGTPPPTPAAAPRPAENAGAFDKLKGPEGNWKAETPKGLVLLSFRVVGQGGAVLETVTMPDKSTWISVYTVEAGEVWATHYSAACQVRLKGKLDGNALQFAQNAVLNGGAGGGPALQASAFTFKDTDHLEQEWQVGSDKVTRHFTREYVDTLK